MIYDPYSKQVVYEESKPAIPVAEKQEDSTATTVAGLKADFNALLAKLKQAGIMKD